MRYLPVAAVAVGAGTLLAFIVARLRHTRPRREIHIGTVSERWLAAQRTDGHE